MRVEKSEEEGKFYALKALVGLNATEEAWMRRRAIYLTYRTFAGHQEFCGDVLEQIVDTALETCGAVTQFEARFPVCKIPKSRPLDFVVEIGGVRWGGEVKNLRKWLYPESVELWQTFSKCCELDVVPLIIARKFHHVSFVQFKAMGGLGYQTHFQFFHPAIRDQMELIRGIDGLGFKDIRFGSETSENLVRFFRNTVGRMADTARKRFEASKEKLRRFADQEGLSNPQLSGAGRSQTWAGAWRELRGDRGSEAAELDCEETEW